jgi:hypothetical protein
MDPCFYPLEILGCYYEQIIDEDTLYVNVINSHMRRTTRPTRRKLIEIEEIQILGIFAIHGHLEYTA